MIDLPSSEATPPSAYPGRPRVLDVSAHHRRDLSDGWTLCSVAPGSAATPEALADLGPVWQGAVVPGTVAESVRCGGTLDLEHVPDFDALDWWYRCRFVAAPATPGTTYALCLDGLATLADVWMNGVHVLSSENMFVAHEIDVGQFVQADNEIAIRFRSLRTACDVRRPRPRWRTKLVEHQQLRWHRTTLLGRMPGWSPPVRPVGPWRAVRLERRALVEVVGGDAYPIAGANGGTVHAAVILRPLGDTTIRGATLRVGDSGAELSVAAGSVGEVKLTGTLAMPHAEHWWPHTHGAQPRYDARLVVETSGGEVEIALGLLAFRRLAVDQSNVGFALQVNGTTIFCRGACWTTPDIVALDADIATYRRLLTLARDAGMNMLRVGGTMVYESDSFYDLCDELGILVWQDFMFANMDYPAADPGFVATVSREADGFLARARRHPSLGVLCGNSEVEQQAAMLGLEAEMWSNSLFRELLPAQCAASVPGVPYCPGSPSGGDLPFHADAGVAHYYGVGAYLRPLDDARRSNVRFAAECLAFSNVPEQRAIEALLPNGESPVHHPRWKARVPRDHGTGWDFEDVRDHYLAQLFAVDPMRLRYADMDRYLSLSRIVTGEVMARTIGEWRRGASPCRGALLWFFQDLWAGAGWGLVDADGRPKPAYYAVKRAMQPVAVALTDEGANGVHVHVANDRAIPLDGEITLSLLRGGGAVVAQASARARVAARGTMTIAGDALLGRFYDAGYAYRFGPPGHDVVVATLRDAAGAVLSETVHFPAGIPTSHTSDPKISASAAPRSNDTIEITLRAERFAQWVAIDAGDFVPDDNYFHMMPGSVRAIQARAQGDRPRFNGGVQPLNASEGIRIQIVAGASMRARVPA